MKFYANAFIPKLITIWFKYYNTLYLLKKYTFRNLQIKFYVIIDIEISHNLI